MRLHFVEKNSEEIRVKGSATIELLYIMPVIFLVFIAAVYMSFFFHDKNILQGITYEALLIASSQYREVDGIQKEEIALFLYEKGEEKMLFFPTPEIEIEIEEEEIWIRAISEKNGMKIEVEKYAPLLTVEDGIRSIHIIEGVVDK